MFNLRVVHEQSAQISSDRIKDVVKEVLDKTELADKRASKMEQDDFLRFVTHAFIYIPFCSHTVALHSI